MVECEIKSEESDSEEISKNLNENSLNDDDEGLLVVKNHKCNLCEKKFSDLHKLKKHTKFVHEKNKEYKCDLCNESFGTASYLKNHIKR